MPSLFTTPKPSAFRVSVSPQLRRSLPRDAPQGSTTPKTLDHPRERSGAEGEPRPSQIPPGTGAATPAAMKLTVKTLKGTHFEIRVQPNDTVSRPDPHSVLNFSFSCFGWGRLVVSSGCGASY